MRQRELEQSLGAGVFCVYLGSWYGDFRKVPLLLWSRSRRGETGRRATLLFDSVVGTDRECPWG